MDRLVFNGDTYVEMQGNEVLQFLSLNYDHAEYNMIGFDESPVKVLDYRSGGLSAISQVLETGRVDQFPRLFNNPAMIKIWKKENGILVIEMRDAQNPSPQYMLWAAIGIKNPFPEYDYVFRNAEPLQDGRYALLSLYKRPKRHKKRYPIFSALSR